MIVSSGLLNDCRRLCERFAAHNVEALLVYLACQDRPLGRDELAELLWPERTQEQLRMILRGAIYRLRGQVEPNAAVDLDARQFERYLAAGELAMATALYRGDFLGVPISAIALRLSSGRCWNVNATLPVLVGLVDKSLVRTNSQGRFDLHELVRQYAAYLQLFRTGDSHLRGPDAARWFAGL